MEVKQNLNIHNAKYTDLFQKVTSFWILLKSNLLEFRLYWVWYFFMMSFNGAMFVILLWLLGGKEGALYAITGSMTMTLTTAAALSLGQEIGGLKDQNAFEFYATLPISKLSFIFALSSRSLIFALPSLLISMLFGVFLFNFEITVHPILILIIILGGSSLIGVGALIGFYSKNGRVAGIATQVVQPLITFLAPVFVPYKALPLLLQKTSVIFPTTYIARTLRAALGGQVGPLVYRDLLILTIWVIVSFILIFPKLHWRMKN
ncbi:MAG: ABC transporter permease [Halanaerobiales bacterium]|nr:ABC transporter permease [Halanaerobiales bacterium]